jgi:hypothetical protein
MEFHGRKPGEAHCSGRIASIIAVLDAALGHFRKKEWNPSTMFPSFSSDSRNVQGGLAGAIALVLLVGVFALVFKSIDDDGPSQEEVQQEQQEEERRRQEQATQEGQVRAEADRQALTSIEQQLEECRTKYLPAATERAEEARAHQRELEAKLNQIIAQLPPGRAKDTLTAQIGPDVASADQLITAEQQSLETRCKMAFTIFQYTRESPPPPTPAPPPP